MTVGIVGLGLIGGSFAKAYHAAGHTVLAFDTDRSTYDFAVLSGTVNGPLTDETLSTCDLILIAVIPSAAVGYLKQHAAHIGPKPVVIDCCGTKRVVCTACFPLAKQFGFTMTLADGRKIACCGDEPYCEQEYEYVKGSTLMLHEAFCLYSQRDIFEPYKKNHSTVKDACELAEKLGVPNLVLYHTEDKNIENRKALYTEEGKAYYHGNLVVPDDLETLEL